MSQLTTLRIHGAGAAAPFIFGAGEHLVRSGLASTLEVLELRETTAQALTGDPPESRYDPAAHLRHAHLPRLRVLVLNGEHTPDDAAFWRQHPRVEHLELGVHAKMHCFAGFERGMLPRLTTLKVRITAC